MTALVHIVASNAVTFTRRHHSEMHLRQHRVRRDEPLHRVGPDRYGSSAHRPNR